MKNGKSAQQIMRSLHRDIGFFCLGFVILYALSGTLLIYRDTDFLKQEKQVVKNLKPNLAAEELGKELRMKEFKVTKTEGDVLFFKTGTYNSSTGVADYTVKELPKALSKLTELHKSPSGKPTHWATLLFGTLLLFLGISSMWMFKPKSSLFRRGLYLSAAGILVTIILIFI